MECFREYNVCVYSRRSEHGRFKLISLKPDDIYLKGETHEGRGKIIIIIIKTRTEEEEREMMKKGF